MSTNTATIRETTTREKHDELLAMMGFADEEIRAMSNAFARETASMTIRDSMMDTVMRVAVGLKPRAFVEPDTNYLRACDLDVACVTHRETETRGAYDERVTATTKVAREVYAKAFGDDVVQIIVREQGESQTRVIARFPEGGVTTKRFAAMMRKREAPRK